MKLVSYYYIVLFKLSNGDEMTPLLSDDESTLMDTMNLTSISDISMAGQVEEVEEGMYSNFQL